MRHSSDVLIVIKVVNHTNIHELNNKKKKSAHIGKSWIEREKNAYGIYFFCERKREDKKK